MEGYPFACAIEVRYADIDAMDHVNNAVIVSYLEVARSRFWQDCMNFVGSAREIPFILARVAVDYRAPIGFGDQVEVGVRVRALGRTSFAFEYRVEANGRLAAEAESVQVLYDYEAGRSLPLSEATRARLAALR